MILRNVAAILDGQFLTGADLSLEVGTACGADLMSDVLTFIHSGSILLTGLTNPQVVRTAEMVDVAVIIFVRGKKPSRETIDLANEKGIPLISAPHTMFECCGRLYMAGIEACDVRGEARRRSDRRLHEFLRDGTLTRNG